MRHRAPRRLLPSRPSLRLATALGATIVLLTGGVLVAGALDDDGTVPAVDQFAHDRSRTPGTSRSTDRPVLSPFPDADVPEATAPTPDDETTPETASPEPTPTQETASPGASSLPVPTTTPTTPIGEAASVPVSATSPTAPTTPPDTGGDSSPAPRLQDRVAPSTSLDSAPRRRDDSTTAEFSFHASEDASFTCSLDGETFRPCGSGVAYTVQPGWHDFAVRATDRAGNVDPTPARWHWHTSGHG